MKATESAPFLPRALLSVAPWKLELALVIGPLVLARRSASWMNGLKFILETIGFKIGFIITPRSHDIPIVPSSVKVERLASTR